MKLKELIRYIENTAPYDSMLYFYNASDERYSTGTAEFINGSIEEKTGFFRVNEIVLNLRAAGNDGISLYRDDFIAWLYDIAESYGSNIRILMDLHGSNGNGNSRTTMLTDDMWSLIEHQGDGCYALREPTKATLGYSFADATSWEGAVQSGGFGS